MGQKNEKWNIDFESDWIRIRTGISDFQRILQILNRFYRMTHSDGNENSSRTFREEFANAHPENIELFVRQKSRYEYLIFARLQDSRGDRTESWVHLDGIQEERDAFLEQGIRNHPVFWIQCLSDILSENKARK